MPQAPMEPRFYDSLDRLNFVYPHYESPFQVSINPNFSRWMDRYCCQWAVHTSGPMRKQQAYVDSIYRSDLGFFSAVCFPSANWHRLEKLMKWCLMFFIADDYHDIVTQMTNTSGGDRLQVNYFWQHMIDMLDGLERRESFCKPEWPDFIRGIQSVLSEIYFDYNDEQVRRSVRMIKDYIEGNVLETQWYTSDGVDHNNNGTNGGETHYGNGHPKPVEDDAERIPSWEEYMRARLGSVGGQMSMQLIEFATGVALPEHQFSHPTMRALVEAISREMTLVNDYLTFRKEVAENNYKFSQMRHAFTVLVNQGMTLQEAVNYVHEMLKKADNEVFRLMDEMMTLSGHSEQMRRYLEGVSQFVGGYWRHAVTARRYHGLDFTGSIPPEGHFLYDPNQTVIVSKAYSKHRYPWQSEVPDNVQPS